MFVSESGSNENANIIRKQRKQQTVQIFYSTDEDTKKYSYGFFILKMLT